MTPVRERLLGQLRHTPGPLLPRSRPLWPRHRRQTAQTLRTWT